MPNATKLLELLSKLPKGSKASQEAVKLEMELQEAIKAAQYAGHTPATDVGQSSLSSIRDILGTQEFPVKKMGVGGKAVSTAITDALNAAKAALKGEVHTAARGSKASSILTKEAKQVPPPAPRAQPKTKQELSEIAERIAPQLQGEFVRGKKGTTNVAGKSRKQFDLEQQLEHDLRRSREVPEAQPIDLASRKGNVMLSLPGDFTIADQDLYKVGDVSLREPSRQYGGPRFGLGHPEEAGWASGLSAAGKFQRGVTEASQQYGDVPVLANYMMMGPEGVNYALHFADANLKAIDPTKMTKKNIRDFNSLIKRGHPKLKFPEFAGIDNPDLAYEQMAADPELRKHFNSIMQMPTVAEAFKMPSGLNIRHAVTEPELRNLERGMTGFSLMEMEPGVASLNVSKHPTYSHDIPGTFLGKTDVPMPYELTFPDTVAQIRANPRQAPYEFGTLQFGGGRQIIDQQLIDEIGEYRRRLKELTGKKEGGMAGGGQAFPLQDELEAEMERRRTRPRTRAGVPVEDTNALGGALQGLGEMLLGAGRGAVSTTLGAPADILNLLNVKSMGTPDISYGSEYFKENLPFAPTTHTGQVAQQLGEFLPLPVAEGYQAAKSGVKKLAPTAKEMLEIGLEKSMSPAKMYAVPPSEAKAGKIKAPANEIGFYNPAEKAALNLQRKKGMGDAFISDLKKQPGVTDERLAELGIDQFRGKPNVTREEIIAAAEENRIPLQESVKRERDETRIEELENRYEDLLEQMSEAEASRDRYAMARIDNEMQDNLIEQKALKSVEGAKFSPSDYPDYSMPGGENYREIRIGLPSNKRPMSFEDWRKSGSTEQWSSKGVVGEDFLHKQHHGDEPNVLLHLRVANHADAEGKKGLLIDELQSDWHQQGREKGYGNKVNEQGHFVMGVPDAPFKDNWYQLGLKRAIKEAVDTGMDRVYLTTGARQNERWSLKHHVDSLQYDPSNQILDGWKDGQLIISKEVPKDELAETIGKEAADKLLKTESTFGKRKNKHELSGVDLDVGGAGMEQWYDKTYKNYLKNYAKQHGSKSGMTTISNGEPVYYIEITDPIRETVEKGQRYAEGGEVQPKVIDLQHMMTKRLMKGFAVGGAVYNTTPDFSDSQQMIPGPAV